MATESFFFFALLLNYFALFYLKFTLLLLTSCIPLCDFPALWVVLSSKMISTLNAQSYFLPRL